jgi:hypothetical protein
MYFYLTGLGLSENQSLLGSALTAGLSGVVGINFVVKYLSDGFAIMCMLCSVISFNSNQIIAGILFSALGSMAKESCFVYSTLISWNPYAVLGAVPVLIRYLTYKSNDKDILNGEQILKHPLQSGIKFHREKILDMKLMLLTWGAGLASVFGVWDFKQLITVLVAYGSQLFATDTQRIYMWCFPCIIAVTVTVIPEAYYVPAVLATWFNPFRMVAV